MTKQCDIALQRAMAWLSEADLRPTRQRVCLAAALIGDSIYVWGGKDANGPAAEAVRGDIAVAPAVGGHSAPVVNPDQGDAEIGTIYRWDGGPQEGNLPTPRDGAALWSANGTLYVATGTRLFATAMKTTPTVR